MEKASTTLKMTPSEHQRLVAQLQFRAKAITEEQFRAILVSSGWEMAVGWPIDRIDQTLAESLLMVVR